MIINSGQVFIRNSIAVIQIFFHDENGVVVIPLEDSVKWDLTTKTDFDITPEVINDRKDVAADSASGLRVVLTGNDLDFLQQEYRDKRVNRVLTISYLYDSNNGSDLPGIIQYEFEIENVYNSV